MNMSRLLCLSFIVLYAVFLGCGGSRDVPREITQLESADALRAQPAQIDIEGLPLVLNGSAILNRMPISDGKIAFYLRLVVGPTGRGILPEGLRVVRVAAVNASVAWWTYKFEQVQSSPNELTLTVGEGPLWGADTIISVVVSVLDKQGRVYHVRLVTTILAVD